MRLKIMLLALAVLVCVSEVSAQDRSQKKDPQYYHFLMQNCPGKNLKVTLNDGQKLTGICHAQLVDRVQITREGVTYDIPYTSIAKMTLKRNWLSKCFGRVKETAVASYFCVYLFAELLTSRDKEPW
jgi:hypothetical protein